ncbi:restriction endonuclease subunit S [Azotobacter salinestris]|uniref:restriction endonuclease subunit S n=1 Tax=Azotobacter salinestris TaxID=69964 RepID=UPI0032DFC3B2
MSALLTDNLPLLAGAPNGIRKLRELILELAVRGKLVAQDPSDEPASELLKRIAEEKARLVAEGRIRKQKALAEIGEEEKPFELPEGWEWVRLGDSLEMINGRAFKPAEWKDSGLPIVRIQNLNRSDAPFNYCDGSVIDSRHLIDNGSFLISWSGTPGTSFGAFIWRRGKAALNQHIFSCVQKGDAFFDEFLRLAINTRLEELIAKAHGGVGLQHVTKGKLEALTLVLPPVAEQHRIIAKVDELMVLCDRLEARQSDAASAHTRLVQALLDSLPQASDAADFAASWQRLSAHFHSLFTSESSIDALKQTLLQLAVMGKLVPQDPEDEPASELLKRIAEEKAQLVAEGMIKKQKPMAEIGEEKKPFALPKRWEWCRIKNLVFIKHGYAFSSSYFRESVCSFILTTPGNFFETGGFRDRGGRTKYYCGPVAKEFILDSGDLIVAMTEQATGLLGSAAFIPEDGNIYLHNQRLGKLVFNRELLSPKYLFYYFNGPFLRACISKSSTGMKVKHTSPEKIGIVSFPLPPLAEQHRIVTKLDELFALCDQLKSSLSAARQLHERLAATLLEQAVA